ncbi:hypothetical protein N9043_00245 [bacterium]|nr:hypothetical protein [bacterium]
MNEISIKQAATLRKELEKKIRSIVSSSVYEYEEKTGLKVESIEVSVDTVNEIAPRHDLEPRPMEFKQCRKVSVSVEVERI